MKDLKSKNLIFEILVYKLSWSKEEFDGLKDPHPYAN